MPCGFIGNQPDDQFGSRVTTVLIILPMLPEMTCVRVHRSLDYLQRSVMICCDI